MRRPAGSPTAVRTAQLSLRRPKEGRRAWLSRRIVLCGQIAGSAGWHPPRFRTQIDLAYVSVDLENSWVGHFFSRNWQETGSWPSVISFWDVVITMEANIVSNTAPVPQHVLHRQAVDLSRRIYTSLPWGFRIARLFEVLAADSLDAFGRVITAQMILAVVRGIPDIGGKPASDWIQEVYRRGADAIPSGTGRHFAGRVYKILLSKFNDPEVAEEAMSKVMLQAARGKINLHNGSDIHDAESFIITIALNGARDLLRAKGRRREDPLVRDRDDEPREIDITDPEAFRDLDKSIAPTDMNRILQDAARVSPRAREYLESVLRGESQTEWARELGVTDAAVSKFIRKVRPKLQEVLRDHFRAASRTPPFNYDFR